MALSSAEVSRSQLYIQNYNLEFSFKRCLAEFLHSQSKCCCRVSEVRLYMGLNIEVQSMLDEGGFINSPSCSCMIGPLQSCVVCVHACLNLDRFVPRHADELYLETDDPVLMVSQSEDLWCQGYNMRTGSTGIFPTYYAVRVSKEPSQGGSLPPQIHNRSIHNHL